MARAAQGILPTDMSATDESLDALNRSCVEFVSLLATEAREVGKSSVMSKEDVVAAIKQLGLEAYLDGAEARAAADAKVVKARKQKKRPKVSKEEQEAAAIKQRELLESTAESYYGEQGL